MTIFQKIKKLVSRHTKDFQVISEHILLQNCGFRTAVLFYIQIHRKNTFLVLEILLSGKSMVLAGEPKYILT